jgi:hypothetical protein
MATKRQQRQIKSPQGYADYKFCNNVVYEPNNDDEMVDHKEWRLAMEEIHMIEKNQTWNLVEKPTHKDVVGVKWIYKTSKF